MPAHYIFNLDPISHQPMDNRFAKNLSTFIGFAQYGVKWIYSSLFNQIRSHNPRARNLPVFNTLLIVHVTRALTKYLIWTSYFAKTRAQLAPCKISAVFTVFRSDRQADF